MIKPGLESLLSVALLSELDLRMGLEADEFLIGAGERIGEAITAPDVSSMAQLEAWMNALFAELGLGEVLLSTARHQLVMRHRLPINQGAAPLVAKALPSLIEGIYRAWMNQLDPSGQVTRHSATEREIEFIYAD